jgi:Tfp pilus assembly protein PilP
MRAQRWTAWVLAVLVAVFGVWTAYAQEDDEAIDLDEEVDVSMIEQILRGDEEVLRGQVVAYDPAGRRDPFRSLLEGFQEEEAGGAKVRPPGLPGMLVEELRVEGIIQTPSGILAFVQGRDNLSYIIRPGTKLYNGEVKEILPGKVVFRRQVDDPKQIRPYQEVVRELVY